MTVSKSRIKAKVSVLGIISVGIQNESEPSKQASKVSGITNKSRTYTEVKDADSEPAVEVAAVAGVHQSRPFGGWNK